MKGMPNRRVIVAGVAALAVAVTGGAIAATKATSPRPRARRSSTMPPSNSGFSRTS